MPTHLAPTSTEDHQRTIRSFVMRSGRLTTSQKKALDDLWSVFGIERGAAPIDFSSLFGNNASVILEIGYGMGDSLVAMAAADPGRNFIGIEVHLPGIGNVLNLIQQQGIQNLRLLDDDAVHIIKNRIPAASLERVQLYFPDPWHKRKHRKRRIVQAEFVELLASKLINNGTLHLATDWKDYATQMVTVMNAAPHYKNISTSSAFPYIDRPSSRPVTRFEKRGLRLGHGVWDLIYQRI